MRTSKLLVIGLISIVFLIVAVGPQTPTESQAGAEPAASFEVGKGINHHFSYATADDLVETSSLSFEEVLGMKVGFKKITKGPVLIRFCAASNNGGVGSMQVKAQVDGIDLPFGPPGGMQYAASQVTLPRCFTWVASNLGRGHFTFGIVWRKFGGGRAFMLSRTLVVEGF